MNGRRVIKAAVILILADTVAYRLRITYGEARVLLRLVLRRWF
jgi:hypothetical protein